MADENNIGGKVGLDITDFKSSVIELNRQIKVIDTGFKAAAAGMDDWASSEEGLQQRISALNQITDLQKQKIANLTEQYKQVADAKGEDSKAAQDLQIKINNETAALNKNLKELNDSTTALNNFGKESEETAQDVSQLSKSTDDAKKNLGDIGGNIAKGAAAGIAAIGAAAVAAIGGIFKFSNDSQKALNNFQVQTGYASDEMEEFKDIANNIYADNFGENMSDITQSMATINQTAGLTGDALKDATEQALLMRDAFGFEVNESIDTVNALMANFGLTSEQAYNLIAQGAQKGANKNGDLLDVMKEYAPNFKALGLNAEEFTDTLIQGSISGAFQIDKVGDAVKEFSIRSKDGSKTSEEGFKALGLNAQQMFKTFAAGGPEAEKAFQLVITKLGDMKDPLAQNQAGVALFGTQFEDLGIDAIKALGDIENYAKLDVDALGQINNIKHNNFDSALEGLKRKLITSVAEPIGKELTPRINELIGKLSNVDVTPIVNGLGWIMDNANNIASGIVSIGTGFAVWNVASMITGVVKGIKEMQKANEALSVAQALVAMTNPFALIAAAIAGLIAGIIYLWNTNEGFRNAIIGAWNAIKSAGEAVWQWLVNFFTVDIPNAFNAVANFFAGFPTIVSQLITNIVNFFNELPGKIGYALGYAIGTIIKFGVDFGTWVINTVPRLISMIVSFFWSLPGMIASAFVDVLKAIYKWGADLVAWAVREIPAIVIKIVEFFNDLPGKMLDIGKNIVKGIWNGITSLDDWLGNKLNDFAGGIVRGLKEKLGIHSPSRVMRDEVGLMIGAGMAKGIENSARQVNSAMASLNRQVVADGNVNIGTNYQGSTNSSSKNNSTFDEFNGTPSTVKIIVPVNIEGKQVAEVTAPYDNKIQGGTLAYYGRSGGA